MRANCSLYAVCVLPYFFFAAALWDFPMHTSNLHSLCLQGPPNPGSHSSGPVPELAAETGKGANTFSQYGIRISLTDELTFGVKLTLLGDPLNLLASFPFSAWEVFVCMENRSKMSPKLKFTENLAFLFLKLSV